MTDDTIAPPKTDCNEDYTGVVCWALWHKKSRTFRQIETLVDVEDFQRLQHLRWNIHRIGKGRVWRVVRNGGSGHPAIYLSREILGFPRGKVVDHRDGNTVNDRRRNLRACSIRENNLNTRAHRNGECKGVSWCLATQRWRVMIGEYFLGDFVEELEATGAYDRYVEWHFGKQALKKHI